MYEKRTRQLGFTLGVFLFFNTMAANAEVTASADHGFISEHTLILQATPAQAWLALTDNIHLWWDGSHSYSGDAGNFSLAAVAGGCFCEQLPDGGQVEHMRVVFAAPGKQLRLSGGLGPLQEIGAGGSMTFILNALDNETTELQYRYVVSGFLPSGLQGFAGPVDQVQLSQLQRLQSYLANTP